MELLFEGAEEVKVVEGVLCDPATRAVLDVARDVLADLDIEAVLARVLKSARELSGARYAALGVLDQSGRGLERFITVGLEDADRRQIGALPRGYGVLGMLTGRRAPLRLADVSAHPRSFGFPPGHPPMKSFLGVGIMTGGQPVGNLYLTEKVGGGKFSDQDEVAVAILAEFAGVAIDHARRYAGLEARRADLERTVDALNATLQVAQTVGGETNIDAILELVATRGRALLSARVLVIEQERDGEMVVAAGAGELPDGVIGQRVSLRESVAGVALREVRTLCLADDGTMTRFERQGLGRLGVHADAGLVVPLVCRGESHGALVAIDRLRGGPGFTPDDQRLVEAFAASVATALGSARAVAAERRSQRLEAAERERERWARELHDRTLQALAAVRIALGSQLRGRNPERMAEVIADAVRQLDSEMAGLRSLITELRPAALDDLGLEAAIEALADRARLGGLQVHARVDLHRTPGRAVDRHGAEVETALYRIAQEALINARKHGHGERALVEVREDHDSVRVTVRDNGHGFDPTAGTDGFGLLAMRERAELLRGTLEIDSAPGFGTTVTATIPAQRQAHPDATRTIPHTHATDSSGVPEGSRVG